MIRFSLLALLACCTPTHRGSPAPVRESVDSLPRRSLSQEDAFAEIWRPELRPPWRDPTPAESTAVASLVPELLRAAATREIDQGAVDLAGSIQMRIERWEVAGHEHLVLTENPDARRGAGAYLFSLDHPATTSPWLLWQAPHAYHDINTGRIAGTLYFATPAGPAPSAFFTNTIHRYTLPTGKRDRTVASGADACHSAAHLLNVATQSAARAVAGATVVQLHGFGSADDDDDGRLPAGALAVVSAGDKVGPSALSTTVATRLASLFGAGVLLFPTQATALGATTNVEMLGLRDAPGARFLHLETSAELRTLLVQDPTRRDQFGAAVFALSLQPTP